MNKIFIPSKNRANNCNTAKLLNRAEDFKICVEPQNYNEYKSVWGADKLLNIGADNMGITYVRNWILSQTKEPFWMLDDDISGFYLNIKEKNVKTDSKIVLEKAEEVFNSYGLAQGALEYQQYGWGKKTKMITLYSYCDVAVWMRPRLIGEIKYRERLKLKVDRDITLQLIAGGRRVGRYSLGSFSAPKNGSNAGGLSDDYAKKTIEKEAVNEMCKIWPEVVTAQVKKDGRYDCKIDWKKAQKLYARL